LQNCKSSFKRPFSSFSILASLEGSVRFATRGGVLALWGFGVLLTLAGALVSFFWRTADWFGNVQFFTLPLHRF